MPRARRIYLENAVYYIALEGPSREPVFRDQVDYLKYTELLNKYKTEYGFKLFSYTLLENSIYLLIEANEEFPVSQIMQKITPTYTKYYNAKYNRSGHLFQKRYRSVYIEKSAYLPRLTRYIHLLSEQLQKEPSFKEYAHSSYAQFEIASASSGALPRNDVIASRAKHIFGEERQVLPEKYSRKKHAVQSINLKEEVQEVMTYLSGDANYEHFMSSQTAEDLEFLEKKLSRGSVLGTEQFEAEVKERIKEASQKKDVEIIQENAGETISSSAFRGSTLALSGLLVATVFLSAYSVYLGFQSPAMNMVQTNQTVPGTAGTGSQNLSRNVPGTGILPVKEEKADLNGTIWDVELITTSSDGSEKQVKDKIRFTGKGFESYYFLNQGFNPSNYTVTVNKSGVITWETIQRNGQGETVSWHGDWNGRQMEGVMSYRPEGKTPQDFSFLSQTMGAQNA